MAGPMGKFTYVSDDTVSYRAKIDASNAALASVSCVSNPGRPNLPKGYFPRHVWVKDDADVTGGRVPTGARRKIIVCNVAGTAWTSATSLSLPDFSVTPSVSVLWTIEGRIGERRLAR